MSQSSFGERVRRVWLVAIGIFVLATAGAVRVPAQESIFAPDIAKRIGEALEGRRFSPTETARGLRDIYAASVYAVPFIITETATGSGVVVGGTMAAGLVVTNHHVVTSAFHEKDGAPFVVPIPVAGTWLRQVVGGHIRYYGVPMNGPAIGMFRFQVGWLWHRALARRSQTGHVSWERMRRLIERWLPPARICHPYPLRRLGVITRGRSRMR